MNPGDPVYLLVGQNVSYYASPSTEPLAAQLTDNLGGGKYNLRVLGTDGTAFAKTGVTFVPVGQTTPTSGEFCAPPKLGG